MNEAGSIDEVLSRLDAIIAECVDRNSRAGYFAALYRAVTARVKQDIKAGAFDDNPRMERLDVIFANRYLAAYAAWREGRPITGSWRAAFEQIENSNAVILQHLAAGMNAHINLDLAIAAAETAPGDALAAMETDFQRINTILFSMIDVVERRIAGVSPWLRVLGWVGGRTSDAVVRFSIREARTMAWKHAVSLNALTRDRWPDRIAAIDTVVESLGRLIFKPGPMLRFGLWVVRRREAKDPRRVLAALTRE